MLEHSDKTGQEHAEPLGSEHECAPERIPLSRLDDCQRWNAWREEIRKGKRAKVPYSPVTGRGSKSNDRRTWGVRRQAEALAKQLLGSRRNGGIGLQLGPIDGMLEFSVCGIDLDTCRETETGKIEAWALEVVDRLNSYTEVSPSGTGVKVYFALRTADLPSVLKVLGKNGCGGQQYGKSFKRGKGEHRPAIEVFIDRRYFAFTSESIDPRLPGDIADLVGPPPAELRVVPAADALSILTEIGPAFAEGGEKQSDRSPGGEYQSSRDGSRSGYAFRLALKLHGEGRALEDFEKALDEDVDGVGLAAWAEDRRQVKRAWGRAGEQVEKERAERAAKFEDLGEHPDEALPKSEDGVAHAFATRHKDTFRFCHGAGKWFKYNGNVWRRDDTQEGRHLVRLECRRIGLDRDRQVAGVERLARADRDLAVTATKWDSNPWLLGTPSATVDLQSGELRPADPQDFITKVTAVPPIPLSEFDPYRRCPLWLAFLDQTTGGDPELIRFLQQWFGYSLTGVTTEQALVFVYGPGGNGKSVIVNTISGVMGEYAKTAPAETFTASIGDRHPTELAMLKGARLVVANETEQGRPWAEKRINQLTGGDAVPARFMRQDFFEFRPEFKLTIAGNHKPVLKNVNDAARRRFNIIPFFNKPASPDRQLEAKLETEWPGILSWMIAGCLDWQANGFQRPEAVLRETAEYFAQQDLFGAWIEERCELHPGYVATVADLWASWQQFAFSRDEKPGNRYRTFPDALQARGFEGVKDRHGIRGRGYKGLRPLPSEEDQLV